MDEHGLAVTPCLNPGKPTDEVGMDEVSVELQITLGHLPERAAGGERPEGRDAVDEVRDLADDVHSQSLGGPLEKVDSGYAAAGRLAGENGARVDVVDGDAMRRERVAEEKALHILTGFDHGPRYREVRKRPLYHLP